MVIYQISRTWDTEALREVTPMPAPYGRVSKINGMSSFGFRTLPMTISSLLLMMRRGEETIRVFRKERQILVMKS